MSREIRYDDVTPQFRTRVTSVQRDTLIFWQGRIRMVTTELNWAVITTILLMLDYFERFSSE